MTERTALNLADSPTCLNCGTSLAGAYCHVCGQRADTERITNRRLWGQVFQALVDVDRGFLYTLKVMTVAPGRAIKDYLAGKRAPMYNPFRFYILVAAVSLLTIELSGLKMAETNAAIREAFEAPAAGQPPAVDAPASPTAPTAEAKKLEQEAEKVEREVKQLNNDTMNWIQQNMQAIQLIGLPLIAFCTWWPFRRFLNVNYAEVVVLQCFLSGYSSLVMVPLVPLVLLLPNSMGYYALLGFFAWFVLTMRVAADYRGRWSAGVVLRTIAVLLVYFAIIVVFSIIGGLAVGIILAIRSAGG